MTVKFEIVEPASGGDDFIELVKLSASHDAVSEDQFFGEGAVVVHIFEFATASIHLAAAVLAVASHRKAIRIIIDRKELTLENKTSGEITAILGKSDIGQ